MKNAPFENLEEKFKKGISTKEWSKIIQGIKDAEAVYVLGNGGNMAVASHAAADITRLTDKRVYCLDSPSLLTSIANDFGYENIFTNTRGSLRPQHI